MLLILDIGTSSMRGMLMDCYGHMLKSIQKNIPCDIPRMEAS